MGRIVHVDATAHSLQLLRDFDRLADMVLDEGDPAQLRGLIAGAGTVWNGYSCMPAEDLDAAFLLQRVIFLESSYAWMMGLAAGSETLLELANVMQPASGAEAETARMINAGALGRMWRRAVIVNTARAGFSTPGIVGRLGQAALNVFGEELLPARSSPSVPAHRHRDGTRAAGPMRPAAAVEAPTRSR